MNMLQKCALKCALNVFQFIVGVAIVLLGIYGCIEIYNPVYANSYPPDSLQRPMLCIIIILACLLCSIFAVGLMETIFNPKEEKK